MGIMLTDLADAARASGLRVVEVDGWRTRTRPGGMTGRPESVICHHTATSDKAAGNYPSLRVVRDGRSDLPGPLAQLGLGRDGTVYVIAAGRANHAGHTALRRQTNGYAIGIECEASGREEIIGTQLAAYVALVRALCDHYGIPVEHVESHAEIARPVGRKSDVRNRMAAFRASVAGVQLARLAAPRAPGKYLTITGTLNTGTVKVAQRWLGVPADGDLGPQTITALQRRVGVEADGKLGPASARALERFLGAPTTTVAGLYPGIIRALQRRLNEEIKAGRL